MTDDKCPNCKSDLRKTTNRWWCYDCKEWIYDLSKRTYVGIEEHAQELMYAISQAEKMGERRAMEKVKLAIKAERLLGRDAECLSNIEAALGLGEEDSEMSSGTVNNEF